MCLFKTDRYFSLKEINIMLSENNKIVLVKNNIYDFTSFNHPGNMKVFINKLGKDVSDDFKFHSISSHKIWNKYFIGKLKNN